MGQKAHQSSTFIKQFDYRREPLKAKEQDSEHRGYASEQPSSHLERKEICCSLAVRLSRKAFSLSCPADRKCTVLEEAHALPSFCLCLCGEFHKQVPSPLRACRGEYNCAFTFSNFLRKRFKIWNTENCTLHKSPGWDNYSANIYSPGQEHKPTPHKLALDMWLALNNGMCPS